MSAIHNDESSDALLGNASTDPARWQTQVSQIGELGQAGGQRHGRGCRGSRRRRSRIASRRRSCHRSWRRLHPSAVSRARRRNLNVEKKSILTKKRNFPSTKVTLPAWDDPSACLQSYGYNSFINTYTFHSIKCTTKYEKFRFWSKREGKTCCVYNGVWYTPERLALGREVGGVYRKKEGKCARGEGVTEAWYNKMAALT